ncbi:MAG: alpha-L-fucosidase [Planctomycetota bacterium]
MTEAKSEGEQMQEDMTPEQTDEEQRRRRMRWWHRARFGMFVHWGLYSLLERHEWAMNRERIPVEEYENLADSWEPRPRPMREWARLASKAGQKYMVMTTKHHEGFCLWDSDMTDYNAVQRGPGRDLVQEYVDACREYDLKIGFYYSLMDWHHPDGARCLKDEDARRRFVDFTHGCVEELMSNYGKIDILWFDVSWPLPDAEAWESRRMIDRVRELQPHIIVNNRAKLPADFGTPEEDVSAEEEGRAWEACMTFNGSWGYQPTPADDWRSVREVIEMLRTATAGGGNLLLNIGPTAEGSVPGEAAERLTMVGKWLDKYGEAVYGDVSRCQEDVDWMPTGGFTARGNTAYYWCSRWPGRELAIGGIRNGVKSVSLVGEDRELPFTQEADRLVVSELPRRCPDRLAKVALLKLELDSPIEHRLGAGCVLPDEISDGEKMKDD